MNQSLNFLCVEYIYISELIIVIVNNVIFPILKPRLVAVFHPEATLHTLFVGWSTFCWLEDFIGRLVRVIRKRTEKKA